MNAAPRHGERRINKLAVAILDTSVLYGNGSRRAIVGACNDGLFEGVWSPHIIGELYRVLTLRWIEKTGLSKESLATLSRKSKDMMDVLTASFQLVNTAPIPNENPFDISDVDDYHLIRAARIARATHIVSNNTNDFPLVDETGRYRFEGIELITASDFLKDLRS